MNLRYKVYTRYNINWNLDFLKLYCDIFSTVFYLPTFILSQYESLCVLNLELECFYIL